MSPLCSPAPCGAHLVAIRGATEAILHADERRVEVATNGICGKN